MIEYVINVRSGRINHQLRRSGWRLAFARSDVRHELVSTNREPATTHKEANGKVACEHLLDVCAGTWVACAYPALATALAPCPRAGVHANCL